MEGNKVLVFSIALGGYSNLFRNCIESQRHYCKKLKYQYILIDKAPRRLLPKEAAWLKLFLLQAALKCDFKWIAFIDADCEIRNHAPSFVKDLKKYEDQKSIYLAHGFSGRINSGVIFLKNTQASINYLQQVISYGDHEVPKEDKALYENGHMIHFGKNNPEVQIIKSIEWNNNVAINKNSYIQHYSGGILREKYLSSRGISRHRRSFLSKLIQRLKQPFSSGEKPVSMSQMHKLLSFYQEKYPVFKCWNSLK